MKALLTGYEPIHVFKSNPSGEVAAELNERTVSGTNIVGSVLRNNFDTVGNRISELIDEHNPAIVICLGLGSKAKSITVERVAINKNDTTSVPDTNGNLPRNEAISANDSDAYFSTLPLTDIVSKLLDSGIPARISNSAGTHCCNNIFYSAREHLDKIDEDVPCGFIHLPITPEMAANEGQRNYAASGGSVPASMPIDMQIDAVSKAIEITADHLHVPE
ncbi:peptidase [Natrialbaceae archaeon A-CW1-1]